MKGSSTRDAAKKLRISFASINRYIAQKKIPVPPLTEIGSTSARLWTEGDIQRVREILPKIANGRKTRYAKKQLAKARAKKKKKPQPRVAVPHKPPKNKKPKR